MAIRNKLKKDLFDVIRKKGMLASEFTATEMGASFTISTKDHYTFELVPIPSGFEVHYIPGATLMFENEKTNDWVYVLHLFHSWLNVVREELETADPWELLGSNVSAAQDIPNQDTPFTDPEWAEVKKKLDSLEKLFTKRSDALESQVRDILDYLSRLEAQGQKLGRKDWMIMFVGTMFSLVAEHLVPEDVVKNAVFGFNDAMIDMALKTINLLSE